MSTWPPPTAPRDQLADRLERLAQRRNGANSGSVERPAATTRHPRRHHPARAARLGALAVSCASAGGLTYLFAGIDASQAADASLAALPTAVTATTSATTEPAGTTAVPAATAVAAATAMTAYDGDTVETRFGPVQVQVQVTNGAITEVAVIAYPNDDGKSVRINANALPTLRTEVLTAQSADIDTVSGATYTSDAYRQSLQSAIDQARADGATTLA